MPTPWAVRLAAVALVALQLGALPSAYAAEGDEKTDAKTLTSEDEPESESSEITPDRPSASDGSSITPPGRAHLETGVQFTFASNTQTYDLASVLGRVGLTDYLEARLSATPVTITNSSGTSASAEPLSTISLGAKLGTQVSDDISIAVLPFGSLSAPTEDTTWAAGANGIVDLGTDSNVGLTLNLGFSSAENDRGERGLETFGAVTASGSLPGKGGLYVEIFGTIPSDRVPQVFFDTGVTYLVTPRLQLDAFLGLNLDNAKSRFVGLGAALLI